MTGQSAADLRFGALGALRVTRAGVRVNLGGRQQRAVLARLLTADGSGVSVEQLADALWGEQPPGGYATTLQTYVFHLRQLLEPDRARGEPGRILITDHGRYRLIRAEDAVDADRFEQATARGLELLAAGAHADAALALETGLAEWQGEPFADLIGFSFLVPVIARLTERRLVALEAKIEADLAIGRHVSVLSELDQLTSEYPLREQLHGQRIVALYRCGRQADALSSYDTLRRRLADELGVDPSPELQHVHQQVLMQDPVLLWQPTSGSVGTTAIAVAAPPAGPPSATAPNLTRFAVRRVRMTHGPHRRGWLIAVAIAALVVAAGTVTAVVVTHQPRSSLAALPANSIDLIDADGSLHDPIPVGQSPTGLAYGFGSLWVANSGDNTVQRINPKTREVIQTILVGDSPVAVAISDHDVWVADATEAIVTKIDPTTYSTVAVTVGALPEAITAGPSGVWVANTADDTVQRIDPATNRAEQPITVGDGPDGLALDGNTLWITNGRDRTVSRIDATTGQSLSAPLDAGAGAKGVVAWHGAVWVADNAAQNVAQLDPTTGQRTASIPVGEAPETVVVKNHDIWVASANEGTVSEIDPLSARVLHRYATGAAIRGMATVGSSLWVTAQAFASRQHVGGTLRIEEAEIPGDAATGLDPPSVYINIEMMAIRPVYDGLIAYRAAAGADSLALVPDLAMDVPAPTEGGRTYTFFVLPKIKYSDGRIVVATDFRRGIERALIDGEGGRPDFFYGVIGGKQCHDRPAQCDLSSGVDTDDQTGRVTIHLTAADPEFLYKLAEGLVVPTPLGIPLTSHPRQPIPGTGPYRIATYTRKALVLTRNRYFQQWSFSAQPAGYPDEIDWRVVASQDAAVADVIAGRTDYTAVTDTVSKSLSDQLFNNHRALLHLQDSFTLQYIILNTHTPPFDRPDVRRAVNYAVDRRQLVDIYGGPLRATEACRALMPGFPGAQQTPTLCAYADDGFVPELDRAKAMIAASGTKGMTIGVWFPTWGRYPEIAHYLETVLTSLGYHIQLHLVDGPDDSKVFAFLSDPNNHLQVDVGPGWTADYPSEATFLRDLFACPPASNGASNRAAYCNKQVDALIAGAEKTEADDLVAARALWQRVEQLVLDDAPIVPVIYGRSSAVTSPRVGDVESGPLIVSPLDQMWVK